MSIIEKAYELGQEIALSKELNDMKEAEMALMSDEMAQKIVLEFNEKQRNFMAMQQQGQELTESQKAEVKDLEERMLDNPLIYSFFQAQQGFEKVLEEVNNIISQAISGGEHSCSDDCCSSCGGGCSN
ncbi:MAG: YlbF family regulator [Firmicutes bacterium]|nr:YlbF family regulator [Bacillota bacterium]